MKTIIKIFYALMFISVILSCNEEIDRSKIVKTPISEIKVVHDRLSFPSTKVYFETIKNLNAMSRNDFTQWHKKYEFNSLLKSNVSIFDDTLSLKRLPATYHAILNADGEVLIGDTIVWYATNGVKHFIPKLNESELQKIKVNPDESKITDTFIISRVSHKQRSDSHGRFTWTDVSNGAKESRWQKEFNYHNDPGSRRKYVHELYNVTDGYLFTLYLVLKLEWKGKHDWRGAGEWRDMSYNISYTISLYGGRDSHAGAMNGGKSDYYQWYDNWNIPIVSDYLVYSGSTYWDIDISGTIYHQIYDDPINGWYNTSNPLW